MRTAHIEILVIRNDLTVLIAQGVMQSHNVYMLPTVGDCRHLINIIILRDYIHYPFIPTVK